MNRGVCDSALDGAYAWLRLLARGSACAASFGRARPRAAPRILALLLAALCGLLLCARDAHAANASCSPAARAGTAPADWATYCWLDFSSYNEGLARAPGGQSFTFTLPDGSTLQFAATVSSAAAAALHAVAAPAWSGAAVGNTAFLGIPGKPILYTSTSDSTVNITFSGITLTPPAGVSGGSTYSFVAADGESTNQNESLSFTTNGANWVVLDKVPPISGSTYPSITNTGATFTETGVAGTVGGYIVGSVNATQVQTTLVAGGLQGAMFALRYATISLNKTLTAGRVNPADQFTYTISATSSGTVLGTGSSSGSGNGPFSQTSSFLTTPQSLTLKEVMATGSVSALAAYAPSLTCTNVASGSPTVLPTNVQATSYVIASIAFGDAISCVFTNSKAGPMLSVTKSGPSPGLKVGTNSAYTLTVTNSGLVPATTAQVKDQLPANLSFVSGTGSNWTCAAPGTLVTCTFSGTLAASATSVITVMVSPATAAAGTSVTNYASIDPTGGSAAPAPGPACTPAGSCSSAGPNTVVYINAVAQSGTAVAGTPTTAIANVRVGDTVNGAPATLGNATIAQSGSWPAGLALDINSGAITTSAAVPPGSYPLIYQLCDQASPPDCATATDTVTVSASIIATAQAGTAPAGVASTPIADVAANDTVNGAAAILGTSGNARVAESGAWPGGLVLNTVSGAITSSPALAPGVYTVAYQLCDRDTPPDCATSNDTITIGGHIVPGSPSGTVPAGTPGTPIADIATGSTVNGAVAALGASGNATVATLGSWPAGITLNPSTGAVATSAAAAPGGYSLMYRLCDRSTPPNCATATATVTITAVIVAIPDSGAAVSGVASTPISNVAANDHVNGAAATLGPTGNATVAQAGTWPSGVSLNTTTGAVVFAPAASPGNYTLVYRLCDRNTPPDCATATDSLTVTGSATALPAQGVAVAGVASTPITDIAAGGTVNGQPATLGPAGNATLAQAGTWPAGLTLNTQTGAVTTAPALAPGVYHLSFQLCARSSPPRCATSTDTITVRAAAGGTLMIDKSASKSQAQIGESVQYRLRVRNTGAGALASVKLSDTLPSGFKLISGTVQTALEPAQPKKAPDPQGAPGPALVWLLGNLAPGAVIDIYYQVRLGVGADQGDGINRAQATAPNAPSAVASAQVLVTPGSGFDTQACIAGKIFVDCNGNGMQDPGEPGIPGVRVYLEDGTNLTSDENGNYSLCGLRPITHVLKIDKATLPVGSHMEVLSSRNAGDGNSLFVDLRNGELHRADFAQSSCAAPLLQQVEERRRQVPLAPEPASAGDHKGIDFESQDGASKSGRPAPGATPGALP